MRYLTVQQLREKLAALPDHTLLVVRGPDHSYSPCGIQPTTAVRAKYGTLSEYFGADYMEPEDTKVQVLLFS